MGRRASRMIGLIVISPYSEKPFDTILKQNWEVEIEMSALQRLSDLLVSLWSSNDKGLPRSKYGKIGLDRGPGETLDLQMLRRESARNGYSRVWATRYILVCLDCL